ncbi:MAG: beta-N-acetylhexosaminidase [Thermoanaerobaculia bacterium]
MRGAAELLVVGIEGTRLAKSEAGLLARLRPGGIALVQRNVATLAELRELVGEIRAAAPTSLLYLDGEGGRVDRLRSVLAPAPAAADLARAPVDLARRAGRWMGEALAALGFDLDFAPVVDLDRGHAGNALDRRCFGDSPRAVVARAGAFLAGLHAAGIGGCLKHFPGLGAARADTHREGAPIELAAAELERDLEPFRRLAAAAESIMIGHAIYPALDPERRPATLSRGIVRGIARQRLRFRGVIFSDDLEMGALAALPELAERGAEALAAGCDGLLFCRRLEAAPEIAEKLQARARLRPRLAESRARVARLRRRLHRLRAQRRRPPESPERVALRLGELNERLQRALQNGMSSSPTS